MRLVEQQCELEPLEGEFFLPFGPAQLDRNAPHELTLPPLVPPGRQVRPTRVVRELRAVSSFRPPRGETRRRDRLSLPLAERCPKLWLVKRHRKDTFCSIEFARRLVAPSVCDDGQLRGRFVLVRLLQTAASQSGSALGHYGAQSSRLEPLV